MAFGNWRAGMNKIREIGLDIDNKEKWYNQRVQRRIKQLIDHNIVLRSRKEKSRKGFHYHLLLYRTVSFKRSIELRHFLFDDPLRIVKDVIKFWNGAKEFDLLFTKKWSGW